MRPADRHLAIQIRDCLIYFDDQIIPLPGIQNQYFRECFVEQIIDSIRRIKYVSTIRDRKIDIVCTYPSNIAFNPFKAAIYYQRNDNLNEAFWLVFLGTHFGKHKSSKWGLVKSVYGELNSDNYWTWERVSTNIDEFRKWLNYNQAELKEYGSFSNHRKYQSLGAYNERGTGSTIASYINWVGKSKDHLTMINENFTHCKLPRKPDSLEVDKK